jgi:hypothetical protein
MELKQKLQNYLVANTDRHNTKWLNSRDPELWVSILNATSFLPETAAPKQRCWHIINDSYAIPTCPITGNNVKWQDNRYLTYSSISAASSDPELYQKKVDTYISKTGFKGHWKNNPEVKEQCRETFAKTKAQGKHKKVVRSETWRTKVQATWDKKYEEQNLADYEKYRVVVNKITRRNYTKYKNLIETNGLTKCKENHLDHIFSVSEAWRNGVDPEIVGHWTNLRVIPAVENMSKNARSDKTLEQLYDDYKNAIQ